jgi:hypothetical protein
MLWESGSNPVQESDFDVVPAEGEPHGKDRDGKKLPEVASSDREHDAHDGGKGHVSRQRATKRFFESRRASAQLHGIQPYSVWIFIVQAVPMRAPTVAWCRSSDYPTCLEAAVARLVQDRAYRRKHVELSFDFFDIRLSE